jgi:lipopolysaccharide transport system ATP-binding protein
MSSEPAIKVEGLSKCYQIYPKPRDRLLQMLSRGRRQYYRDFWALREVSFTVDRGETVGIIGRNGSGKSTLLQMICGTLRPTSGTVKTRGRIAALLELGAGFNPEFTGRQNAVLNAQILGLSPNEIEERLDDIEAFADIGAFFDQPVKTYSSGMYVRVAFAVQACIDPDILVVDEALAVGDEKFQRKCYGRLEQLRLGGTSILLVTHSTTAIERFCQRAVLLHQGIIHGVGPSNEIVDQYHALLYADDASYIRYLNNFTASKDQYSAVISDTKSSVYSSVYDKNVMTEQSGARVLITHAMALDADDSPADVFSPLQKATFRLLIAAYTSVEELQVGMSICTVEGVHAFGTSTLYFNRNLRNIEPGANATLDFTLHLSLAPGAYFVSFALALPDMVSGMRYVDKRTDALLIRVAEPRVTASGIAYMMPEISERRS